MSSQTLLASRFIVAAGLIWAYVLSRKLPFRLPGLQILYLLSIGILSIGVGLFLVESYQYIPGVIATLTAFSYVILVVILEILIGREKLIQLFPLYFSIWRGR
ncbi:MAG: hypothetical protein ACOX1T_04865 [Saccharofermentanales bacterium]|jgi:drug/metabolite transporter (DMT)-like permease